MQSLSALDNPPAVLRPDGAPPPAAAAAAALAHAPAPVRAGWLAAARASVGAIGLAAFMLAALWVAVLYAVGQHQRDAVANAQLSLANLTRAFAEYTSKTLEGADQALRFTRSEYLDKGPAFDLTAYLERKAVVGREFQLLSVVGADGYVLHSTQAFQRVDLHDRDHFRVQARARDDKLFISRPVLGRVSKKWSIQLTRRIVGADGRFDGIVVLSLAPEYLSRFLGEVDLGEQGAIMLVGLDGAVRASAGPAEPGEPADISASDLFRSIAAGSSGTLQARSPTDGVLREWAYRRLDAYGLVVLTGVGVDDVLQEPAELRSRVLGAAALASAIVLVCMTLLVRRARQQLDLVSALEASRSQAQAASRMKTRFLSSVSHELRTPLNGILGYAETIRDTSRDAESRECGGIIHRSATHLHRLVDTILDLARIESGRMVMQPAPMGVEELLRATHAAHTAAAQARGLRLWLALQPGCPVEIRTDARRVRQVLDQLIGNALKFTDEGEVSIVARDEAGHLVVEVSDTGVGIAADRLSTVFDRFESGMGSFDHAGQGAGLGLPLSHELIRLLGGTLTLHSAPGQGTVAALCLPPEPPSHPLSPPEDASHA